MSEHPASHRMRGGGLARWSVRHPIGISMAALAVVVLGLFAYGGLKVDLLPHLIYPEVGVRILDPGVPGSIMEDQVTRQLEEQLAITEDAVSVQSRTSEGRAEVNLSFEYGKDIDVALRDAASRLDRAKRFLPETVDPPIIYKWDPSQIPVTELIASSRLRDSTELRSWVDYVLSKWFLNLPGVAAVEVGGAPERELVVEPDQQRLAGHGLTLEDLLERLREANVESAGGPIRMDRQEINSRTAGRFTSVDELAQLPLGAGGDDALVRLSDVAAIIDGRGDERLRIRLDGVPGVKVSIQKQPQANTVAVADAVNAQLGWLQRQRLIPPDITITGFRDQAVYVRQALRNASAAALSGAVLAVIVIYLFLGDVRRTLVIATAIPLALMVTLILMAAAGLTLNIMTLGGLALGVGLLVDNTIVMLENVYRHQRMGKPAEAAAADAAVEVNSAIVASTSTNLAAVLPFLFVGGLIGLLFRELIATISTAIVASLVVALTLVPALGGRIPIGADRSRIRAVVDAAVGGLQRSYAAALGGVLRWRWAVVASFVAAMALAVPQFLTDRQIVLPELDDGRISARIIADSGISLDEMDRVVERLEGVLAADEHVVSLYSTVGGFVFGRSQYERSNRSMIYIQLVPASERAISSTQWTVRMRERIAALQLAGVRVRLRNDGIRGIRLSRGDDDVSLRVQGPDLDVLARLGNAILERLAGVEGLENVQHSAEDLVQELSVEVDRERASSLGLSVEAVALAVRVALQGVVATDFIEDDRIYDVRLRLPRRAVTSPGDIETILLFPEAEGRPAVLLGDVAAAKLITAPADIRRDRQQRIVEVSGTVTGSRTLGEVVRDVRERLADLELPAGYAYYDGGAAETLEHDQRLTWLLVGLALFLVLVVMAMQYESLRNPVIILLGVPFAGIGVAAAIHVLGLPVSMPLKLGLIMLAGIVVNNAIVLVEYVEMERERGTPMESALVAAGRLRLRPILMTTLTTVIGMLPLAVGIGEGSELLQPLAITIACGLSFSLLVSLVLIPALYRILARPDRVRAATPAGGQPPLPARPA